MIRKLQSVYKDYLWGGTKLKETYHANCDYPIVAEAWLCSNHRDGISRIEGSDDLLSGLSPYALGIDQPAGKDLPILVKLLDAKQDLSVQVHPDDVMAAELENDLGKNEVWYIVDHEPGAAIYYGLNQVVTPEQFRLAVEDGSVLDNLQRVEVQVGDVFYVKAGTIHALGAGITALEVQQSSNSTYRLYDFKRVDSQGNQRPLHLDKGMQAIDFTCINPQVLKPLVISPAHQTLISCPYFTVDQWNVHGQVIVPITESSFHHLVVLNGEVTIAMGSQSFNVLPGESLLIEATNSTYQLFGDGQVIISQR